MRGKNGGCNVGGGIGRSIDERGFTEFEDVYIHACRIDDVRAFETRFCFFAHIVFYICFVAEAGWEAAHGIWTTC